MRIAIIGTGNVGSAIARGLASKGHDITLGARDLARGDVVDLAAGTGASLLSPEAAAAAAEMVILALPWSGAEAAVRALGNLSGKIVIDCMNPLGMVNGALELTVGHTGSAGELVQGWLPEARVVKTLNQVGAEVMAGAFALPHAPVMFMAGNDPAAKREAARLLDDLGFVALDAGDIRKARLLEPLGMVWINQALFRGKGRAWALAVVEPGGIARPSP